MSADKGTESAGGRQSGGAAPTPDASLDELLKWAGQDPAKPAARAPAKTTGSVPAKADDILSGRVVQRGQDKEVKDEEGKETTRRRGFPPVWQLAVGVLVVWVLLRFVASLLYMLGFLALGVVVVAGAYAIGRARGGRR